MKLTIPTGEIKLWSLLVDRYTPESIDLRWDLESIPSDPSHSLDMAAVDVYRSQAPTNDLSEYELIASDVQADQYLFSDGGINGLQHGTRVWYYKIRVKEVADPTNAIVSDYKYINEIFPNRKWLKIYNQKKLSLKRGGRPFVLLKKRTWGERCEVCWDPILFQEKDEDHDCKSFGTGWVNGYFNPIEFRGMISPNPTVKSISTWGEFYPSDSVLTMLNKPPMEIGDIIVDPKTDDRFYIQRTRTLEMLGVPIEQQAQISLVHAGDEIYSIPAVDRPSIDFDLTSP